MKSEKVTVIIQSAGIIICFVLFIIGWVRSDLIWMVGTGFLVMGFGFNLLAIKIERKL